MLTIHGVSIVLCFIKILYGSRKYTENCFIFLCRRVKEDMLTQGRIIRLVKVPLTILSSVGYVRLFAY